MTQVGSYPPRRARSEAGGGRAPASVADAVRTPNGLSEEQEYQRRGSHATTYGQNFGWVLLWTIVGALVPGTGLIAAGRRRIGAVILLLLGLIGVVLIGILLFGNPLKRGLSLAVDPQALMIVAVSAVVIGALWAAIILLTNVQLSRYATLSTGQRVFSGVVVLALIGGVALPAYKVGDYALITRGVVTSKSIFTGDGEPGAGPNVAKADPWADKPRMNVLLIGSDAGSDRIGVRPDTMILASIDTKSGNTVLFSLPRSLQKATFAPGTPGAAAWPNGYNCGSECLINAIWTWAQDAPGYASAKNPGLQATKDAVQGVTGLKVDNYVMLNLNGFKDFVNAIGKVTVNVTERLPIGGNSNYHVAVGGWIEKGKNQKLDGYHALWFARSRWSTDDYSRMQRQRCMIGAVVKKADPATLALNFSDIAKTLKKNLSTGIATSQLDAWVELSQRVKGAKVTSLPFTNKVIDTVDPDIPAVHKLVQKAIKASVKKDTVKSTATPSATPSTSSSPKPTKKPTTTTDTDSAQDLSAVC
jgi:LCP family protein required for cell wall assembly